MIETDQQLQVTRNKLRRVKTHLAERRQDPPSHARDLSLETLQRSVSELVDEIDCYEALRNEPRPTADN